MASHCPFKSMVWGPTLPCPGLSTQEARNDHDRAGRRKGVAEKSREEEKGGGAVPSPCQPSRQLLGGPLREHLFGLPS